MSTIFKSCLTAEQSATLIAKGISADKASKGESEVIQTEQKYGDTIEVRITPIFTLADICSLLPKSIEYNGYAEAKLNIYTRPHRRECWVAKYIVSAKMIPYDGAGEELIDALYEVLWKLLDNGYLLTK